MMGQLVFLANLDFIVGLITKIKIIAMFIKKLAKQDLFVKRDHTLLSHLLI